MQPNILDIRRIIKANEGVQPSIQRIQADIKSLMESQIGSSPKEKAQVLRQVEQKKRILLTLHQARGEPFLYAEQLEAAGFPRLAQTMDMAVDEISPRDVRKLERPRMGIRSLSDRSITRQLPRFEYEGPTGEKQFRILDRFLERERAVAAYDTRLSRLDEFRLTQFKLAELRKRLQWAIDNGEEELASRLIIQGKNLAASPEAQKPNDFFLSKGVGKGTVPGQLKRPYIYSGGVLPVPLSRIPVTENLVANTVDFRQKGVDVGEDIFARGRIAGAAEQLPALMTPDDRVGEIFRDFVERHGVNVSDDQWDDLLRNVTATGNEAKIVGGAGSGLGRFEVVGSNRRLSTPYAAKLVAIGKKLGIPTSAIALEMKRIYKMSEGELIETSLDVQAERLVRANQMLEEEFIPTPKDPEVLGGRRSDAGIRKFQERTRQFVDPDTGQRHEIEETVELERAKKAGRANAENRTRRAAQLRLLRENQGKVEMLDYLKKSSDLATEDDLALRVLVDRELRKGKNLRVAWTHALEHMEQGRFPIYPQNVTRRRLVPDKRWFAEAAAREKGMFLDQRTLRAIRAGDTHSLGVPPKAVEALKHGSKIRRAILDRIRNVHRIGPLKALAGPAGIGLTVLALLNQEGR